MCLVCFRQIKGDNEMTKGKEVREAFGEVYGKIVQDIADQSEEH